VHGFTIPLLTDSQGNKIGKSSEGSDKIWLSREKTSIFDFYQYWINVQDSEVEKLLKAFTFIEIEEIKKVIILSLFYIIELSTPIIVKLALYFSLCFTF
jgi:tyrosyl-tRNA synthetase